MIRAVSAKEQIGFIKWEDFAKKILEIPMISMIWGDIGVGKSTLAIQLSREILLRDSKVFYLHSKKAPIHSVFRRLLDKPVSEMMAKFFIWTPQNFQQQFDNIMQWQHQIQQLLAVLKVQKVGLIVLDEIATNYLLEMGNEKQNEKMNQIFTLQLATLRKIVKEFNIPVVLLNSLTVKKDDQENPIGTAYGGKIVDYWVDFEVLLERTAQMSKIRGTLKKNTRMLKIPNMWLWNLTEKGFK